MSKFSYLGYFQTDKKIRVKVKVVYRQFNNWVTVIYGRDFKRLDVPPEFFDYLVSLRDHYVSFFACCDEETGSVAFYVPYQSK